MTLFTFQGHHAGQLSCVIASAELLLAAFWDKPDSSAVISNPCTLQAPGLQERVWAMPSAAQTHQGCLAYTTLLKSQTLLGFWDKSQKTEFKY